MFGGVGYLHEQGRDGDGGRGDCSTVDGAGLGGVDAVGAVGDGGAVGERTGDAHDQLDGAGGARGEVARRPGDDTAGERAAGGGGDEGGVGRDGVGEDDAGGVGVAGIGIRERVGQIAARRDRVGRVGLGDGEDRGGARRSARLNSSHDHGSYAVYCLEEEGDGG